LYSNLFQIEESTTNDSEKYTWQWHEVQILNFTSTCRREVLENARKLTQTEVQMYQSEKYMYWRREVQMTSFRSASCYSVMAPEKSWWRVVDVGAVSPCAWWITSPLGTPRGRYDECSGKFSLSLETKVYRTGEEIQWRLKVLWNLHTHKQILCSQLAMRLSISPVCLKQRLWVYRVENSIICE
jgi:hypothetical protein